jgi:hypothetical protein
MEMTIHGRGENICKSFDKDSVFKYIMKIYNSKEKA